MRDAARMDSKGRMGSKRAGGLSYALRLLAQRGYSRAELAEKLLKRYDAENTEEVLNRLGRAGYLSDEKLAEEITSRALKHHKGFFYIRSVLRKRKIAPEIAKQFRDNFDFGAELKQAEALLRKAAGRKKPAGRLLALRSRGFSSRTISKVLGKYFENET